MNGFDTTSDFMNRSFARSNTSSGTKDMDWRWPFKRENGS
jgi:hypothetical protein